jgi:DNA-binding NtrC family response regulator
MRKNCACLPTSVHASSDVDPANIYILVLDRNPKSAHSIGQILKPIGYKVSVASHQSEAMALAEEKLFNVVVKAFDPDTVDAIALMNRIRAITPDTQFIFISEKGTIQVAVDAIRNGAYDYLAKPINPSQLVESVRKALDFQALIAEDQQIKMRLRRRSDPDIFAGSNGVMSEISHLIRQIAATDVTVLIEGESGTGKEIVARAIHERSFRSGHPFIAVNCGALHDNLLESELFGHVRGAFTGAISDRKGRFQLAHKGTLFLDEITDLSPKGQGDLLRVLEDSIFRPVGSQKVERADVRLIAATNKSLEMESMNGRFREDLLYRLNVVTINLPPLRERAEDIPHLVKSFAEHYCAKHRRRKKHITTEAITILRTLPWPGNVRQLRNIVERLVVTIPRQKISTEDLPSALVSSVRPERTFSVRPGMSLAQVETELIRQTLVNITSNRTEAAKKLGISRRALQYKIKRYGLGTLDRRIVARQSNA